MAVIERYFLCALIGSMVLSAAAYAAERPYYQGKNITFLINFAAGGPTDIEGRIVARHLAKHIPGNPTIIVQNMPGAGGVTGINFLGEAAKRDSLTLGYFTGPYNHHMMKSVTLRTDLMQLPFVASVGSVTVCSNDARLAVQRNEIQYHDENIPGYRGVVEPQLVKTGIVTPLYYHDLIKPDGTMGKSPDYPELNSFTDVYTQINGKAPTGIKYETLKAANMASQNLSRVALLTPKSPREAVLTLRQAFTTLSKDEEFIAEAKKAMRFQPRFDVGEDGERLRDKVLRAPNEVVDFVHKYIEEVRK